MDLKKGNQDYYFVKTCEIILIICESIIAKTTFQNLALSARGRCCGVMHSSLTSLLLLFVPGQKESF